MIRFLLSFLLASSALGAGFTESLAFRGQGGSDPLLNGLVAAWSLDEQNSGNAGTSTWTDNFAGLILHGAAGASSVGSMTAQMGGAAAITNGSTFMTNNANRALFQSGAGKSFTVAFWIDGVQGGNSRLGNYKVSGGFAFDWVVVDQGFQITVGSGAQPAIGFPSGQVQGKWQLVVASWNDATATMSMSLDAGTPVTGVVVDADPHIKNDDYPFFVSWINAGVDELYYWSRVLTPAEITRLYNGSYGSKYPFGNTDAAINLAQSYLWAGTNKGVTISSDNSNAVYRYIRGALDFNIWTNFNFVLPYAPGGLASALTPIKSFNLEFFGNDIIAAYMDPYSTKVGFVDGDVSSEGLKGNASLSATTGTKYLNLVASAQIPSLGTAFPTINDCGFSIYCTTTNAEPFTGSEFGLVDEGTTGLPAALFQMNTNDNLMHVSMGDNAATIGTNSTPGFYSVNRDSSTSLKMFFGNVFLPFGLYASTNYSDLATTFRGVSFAGQAYGRVVSGVGDYQPYATSSNVLSYLSFHSHFTQTQASNEWFIAERMRQDMGGGFVPRFTFTTLPTNSVAVVGDGITLAGALSGGSPTYQWQKNGVNIAGATDSFYTINHTITGDAAQYTLNALANDGITYKKFPRLDIVTTAQVKNWVTACYTASGTLSSNTIWGSDQFWNGCISDGLDTQITTINLLVPDSIQSAITPLKGTLWVNHGFGPPHLSVNGLTGDGVVYLDTGIDQSTLTATSVGVSYYTYTRVAGGSIFAGASSGFANGMEQVAQFNDGNTYDRLGNASIILASPGNGFYSGQRESSTVHKLYFANSGNAHAQVGATDTTSYTGPFGAFNVFVFGYNNGGSVGFQCADTVSTYSITTGLVAADSAKLFAREQTVRTVFGGGFR